LNCLDGAFSKHGLIVFITTNNKEKLNPALIREGRADLKLEIVNPGPTEIKQYLDVFYDNKFCSIPNINWNYQPRLSMVEVQNICIENKTDVWKSVEIIKSKTN
jgi:ATP-dependent 26S proteasome regulatory subunit